MTIEEVIEMSSAELKAMTDAELLAHFQESLVVCRPELAPRPVAPTNRVTAVTQTASFKANLAKLQAAGLDISVSDFVTKKRKK